MNIRKSKANLPNPSTGEYETHHFETELAQISDMAAFMRTLAAQGVSASKIRELLSAASTNAATTSSPGLLIAADKAKLDVIVDSAYAHNGIYRGKDLTSYFDSGEMTKAISAGTFKDIYIGDYINKNITVDGTTYQVKWEVAHIDYFYKSGDTSCDAHHVVMFPSKTVRVNTPMNATNTTEGAYIGSNMWKTIIPLFNTGIEAAFGSAHVLSHRELLANAISANAASAAGAGWTGSSTSWAWYDVKANIPSEPMIYGGTVFGSSGCDVGNAERQLAIFKFKKFSEGRLWFWLRAVASASNFCNASSDGHASYNSASDSNSNGGCRPYFLLR